MSSEQSWVLVAWTPGELGETAVAHGVAEARARGHGLMVVNATKGDALVDARYASGEDVARLEQELAAEGLPLEVRRSVGGDVADQVLEVADQVDCRLIVIGVRHRTAVGKLLMGSVAQRILLTSASAVLAVKPGTVPDQRRG